MAGAAELNIKILGADLSKAAFASATASVRGLSNALTAPIRGIGAIQNSLAGMAQSAAVTGGILTAGVTAPIAAGFKAALGDVISFERSLNVLQAVTGSNDAQMAIFSKTAVQLGNDIALPGVTATIAATAMRELGKAGLSNDQILGAIRGTLQLATAGQLDFGEAATITARALNAFHLEGNQATRVADLLAGAANASTAEVRDLALAMQQGSASAAAIGVPIEEFVASIALMANAGVVGSDAGTSLKTFFASLTKNTKPAIKAQQKLGVSFVDTAGNIKPLPTIIADLNRALAGMPTGTRSKIIQDIFGSDASRAALILADAGPAALEAMLGAITKQGNASDLAKAQTKGLGGAIEAVSNAWDTLRLKALVPLLPIFTQIVGLGADLLQWMDNLSPKTKAAAAGFIAVVAAAGPLLLLFAGLTGTLSFLLTPFGALVGVLAVLAGKSAKPIEDFEQFKVKFEALIIVIKKLLTGDASFRLLEVAIQNLTGIDVSPWTSKLITGFTFAHNALATFIGALKGDWAGGTSAKIDPLTKAIGNLGLWLRGLAVDFVLALPGILSFGSFLLSSALVGANALADALKTKVVPGVKEFVGSLNEANPLIASLGAFGGTAGVFLGALLAPALERVGKATAGIAVQLPEMTNALTNLVKQLTPAAAVLGVFIGAIVEALPAQMSKMIGMLNILSGFVQGMTALIQGLVTAMVAAGRGDAPAALAALQAAWKGLGDAEKTTTKGIGQAGALGLFSPGSQALADAFGWAKGQGMMVPGQGLADATRRAIEMELAKRGIGATVASWATKADNWQNSGSVQGIPPVGNAFTQMNDFEQRLTRINAKMAETEPLMAKWNATLQGAPADLQSVMAYYLSQI